MVFSKKILITKNSLSLSDYCMSTWFIESDQHFIWQLPIQLFCHRGCYVNQLMLPPKAFFIFQQRTMLVIYIIQACVKFKIFKVFGRHQETGIQCHLRASGVVPDHFSFILTTISLLLFSFFHTDNKNMRENIFFISHISCQIKNKIREI